MPARRLKTLAPSDCGENCFRVTGGFYFAEDLFKRAIGTNDKSAAFDAHVLLAVHRFLLPDTVRLGDLVVFVGDERVRETMLRDEFLMRLRRIGTDTDDHGIV